MNLYQISVYWKYSSENYEYGIMKADSEEDAIAKVKLIYPEAIKIFAYEPVFDESGYSVIFSH